jgi:Family of unknown function (DUF6375)
MKIWNSYGSEHSANLVMIGRFKDAASAEKAKAIIDEITNLMTNNDDDHRNADSYSDGALALLRKVGFYSVAPAELEQFIYDIRSELEGDQLVIRTDEPDISVFLKLMIEKGARVEVYSAHDYPDSSEKAATEAG